MKHLKIFEEYSINKYIYRNTDHKWLFYFLENGFIEHENFISFSFDVDSGGGGEDFGSTNIEFDKQMVFDQGAIEVIYDEWFFEEYPEISQYVSSYKSSEDYYHQHGYDDEEDFYSKNNLANTTLAWSFIIGDYEKEEEIVSKKLTYQPGIITKVVLEQHYPELINLLMMLEISYEIKSH